MKEITHEEFKTLLNEGAVKFEFEKMDGTFKEVIGTTSLNMIPETKWPKGATGETEKKVMPLTAYFDTSINEWRSVSLTKKIKIPS
jgi:WYL_2, Sm-like SH3 beta-barrel fold